MPVYNAQRYVGRAIDSILAQSFTAFEFIIIDDCSTDDSVSIITSFKDRRIRFFKNDQNQGIVYSLNRGIAVANGRLIARMDADDISLPQRIKAQVAFMNNHPEVGICGTYIKLIGSANETMKYYTEDAHIKANLLFETGMAHPAVMMRSHVLENCQLSYDSSFEVAQDYELWTRAAQVTKLANLPQVLLHYNIHNQSISDRQAARRIDEATQLRLRQLQQIGVVPSKQELRLHHQICSFAFLRQVATVKQIEQWLALLLRQNREKQVNDQRALRKVVGDWWYKVCRATTGQGLSIWWLYHRSTLRLPERVPLRSLKILAKCLLRRK